MIRPWGRPLKVKLRKHERPEAYSNSCPDEKIHKS